MSEKESLDKSELLSDYLDEDLTPRQINELRRMLAHDPQMEQEFNALRRQRQLLRSLPVESAPPHLADDIKAALERRFILNHNFRSHETAGKWGLMLRRLAATAAMVLLPLSLLGIVVYTIVRQPSSEGFASDPAAGVTANVPSSKESPATTLNDNPVLFSSVLQFHTHQPVLVRDYVEKSIHLLGLMDKTQIQLLSDRTSYKVIFSRQYVMGLVGRMQELWPRCETVTYAMLAPAEQNPIQVVQITPKQAVAMMELSEIKQAAELARTFTEQNMLAAGSPKPDISPLEQPIVPTLAWDKNTASAQDETQDTICLVIEVLGL